MLVILCLLIQVINWKWYTNDMDYISIYFLICGRLFDLRKVCRTLLSK